MIPLGVLASGYVAPAGGLSLPTFTELRGGIGSPDYSTITIAGLDLGPAQNRTVFIVWMNAISYGNRLYVATIGGVSATFAAQRNGTGLIAYATVGSDVTTGDVTLTASTTYRGTGSLAVYYLSDSVAVTAAGTAYNTNPLTTTVNTSASGFVIASVGTRQTPTHSWSGVTKDRDAAQGSVAMALTDGNALTVTDTLSGTYQYPGLTVASFQPA